MNDKVKLLEMLSNANGAPGFEDEVVNVIRENTNNLFDITEDVMRNVYMSVKGKKRDENKITVMLDAHSDEVAFIVQSIKANGLIKFLPLGGWALYNISAQKVRIKNCDNKYITGIVSSKPPHFLSEEEKNTQIKIQQLFIDVGASSREEVIEKFGIEVGAPIVPDVKFEYNYINDTFIGKAFDNRIGCGCVIETIKALADEDLNVNLIGAIAAQEEVGTRGAVITSNTVKPDIAIVFEGTPADDGFKPDDEAQSVLKKGPQIRHFDRSMITHPRFVKFARGIAIKNNIPIQDAVRSGGGTNGGKIHLSNNGVPTIVIGVPVRYIHTHYGISTIIDYENTIKWATEIVRSLDGQVLETL
ncbi:M42 family peptidase [Clostridiaceae bacterium M8S5]|nr:M42 family peptidase [Clostridiaceae bacterium M8S5]